MGADFAAGVARVWPGGVGIGGIRGLFGAEGFDRFLPGNYPWAGETIFVAELMFCVVTKYFS